MVVTSPSNDHRVHALAAKIAPLARELARLEVHERVLQRRIQHAQGDPDRVARLRERLASVQARQAQVQQQLAPLRTQAQHLADRARR